MTRFQRLRIMHICLCSVLANGAKHLQYSTDTKASDDDKQINNYQRRTAKQAITSTHRCGVFASDVCQSLQMSFTSWSSCGQQLLFGFLKRITYLMGKRINRREKNDVITFTFSFTSNKVILLPLYTSVALIVPNLISYL